MKCYRVTGKLGSINLGRYPVSSLIPSGELPENSINQLLDLGAIEEVVTKNADNLDLFEKETDNITKESNIAEALSEITSEPEPEPEKEIEKLTEAKIVFEGKEYSPEQMIALLPELKFNQLKSICSELDSEYRSIRTVDYISHLSKVLNRMKE
jgi:hypothetical protein